MPRGSRATYSADEVIEFPVGTVLVKTFWMHHDRAKMADARRLETRLLVNSPEGWVGYTYVYEHDGKEATLLDGSATKSLEIETADGKINQSYYFPSRTDCMTCHTKQHGFVLGLETKQLNRDVRYHGEAENQLALFKRLNLFSEPMTETADTTWAINEICSSDIEYHLRKTAPQQQHVGGATSFDYALLRPKRRVAKGPRFGAIAPITERSSVHGLSDPLGDTELCPLSTHCGH